MKASLGTTYKTQTEANDKAWDFLGKTEKALETLAILYARFEKVSRDLGAVDQKFDKEFEYLQDALVNAKQAQMLVEITSQQVLDRRLDYHTRPGSMKPPKTT